MPITRAQLEQHIDRRGPCLFHVTASRNVDAILAEGLRPGSDMQYSTKGGFYKTRAGHVYLCTGAARDLGTVEVGGPRAYLQVDLSHTEIDPALIDPDEDLVREAYQRGAPWVDIPPPEIQPGEDSERRGSDLAAWADTTDGFDRPEVTAKSLAGGRVAYNGTLPPGAITIAHPPCEAAALFLQHVAALLQAAGLSAADPPDLGFYRTEVARSMTLGRVLLRNVADACACDAEVLGLCWKYPEHAQITADALSEQARSRNRDGDLAAVALLSSARHLAEAVAALEPEVGRWADECCNLALAAGELVDALKEHSGDQTAAEIALAGYKALISTPHDDRPHTHGH